MKLLFILLLLIPITASADTGAKTFISEGFHFEKQLLDKHYEADIIMNDKGEIEITEKGVTTKLMDEINNLKDRMETLETLNVGSK